jgi:hypothetical protein
MTGEFVSKNQGTSLMFSQFNPFDFDSIARDKVLNGDIMQQNPTSDYVDVRVTNYCSSDRNKNSYNVTTAQSRYSKINCTLNKIARALVSFIDV